VLSPHLHRVRQRQHSFIRPLLGNKWIAPPSRARVYLASHAGAAPTSPGPRSRGTGPLKPAPNPCGARLWYRWARGPSFVATKLKISRPYNQRLLLTLFGVTILDIRPGSYSDSGVWREILMRPREEVATKDGGRRVSRSVLSLSNARLWIWMDDNLGLVKPNLTSGTPIKRNFNEKILDATWLRSRLYSKDLSQIWEL